MPAAPRPAEASATTAGGARVKARAYTFSGLDVEGKLKTPQLLFFSAGSSRSSTLDPDKRSFMKELAANRR